MSEKPTGVFVRLPLSYDMVAKAQVAYCSDLTSGDKACLTKELLAIGTPVTGGKEICAGSVKWHENDVEPVLETYVPNTFGKGASVKIVTLSDHQAQIAALEAEVVRLREVIHKMIDMSRNAQTWSLNNRPANCRDELSAIGRLGEKTLKGDAA